MIKKTTSRSIITGLLGLAAFGLAMLAMKSGFYPILQQPSATQVAINDLFDALSLHGNDLPNDWEVGGVKPENVSGTEAMFYWYKNIWARDLSWVNFSQEIVIYPNQVTAMTAYDQWDYKKFPASSAVVWKNAPELEVLGHADQIKTACFDASINKIPLSSCEVLARYKNVILVVLGNVFEGRWLELTDFKVILQKIDERMIAALPK